MGDFGNSGYRAEKITVRKYGPGPSSDDADKYRELVQRIIIDNQHDGRMSDDDIMRKVSIER